ncbi:ABC transporter ATP-binding protein [Lederbergia citrea]|uniref:ABC transporter ATP-binding protein n=1 Tax=Lederbergia citrea TaxID=2833581 RepID=A0A942Z5F9_9BACI|nr:ABC transporter ATP-binding protein [Lederbergia citrea]MBS4179175.1 ABC transporter ATP-binding protein [Lederbergia citrea]MBS4205838.1 ABC transporter ATP-binding protein [Lederbergia citrea]MBS4224714.1 ABC transporter ATP-binding protein [Lederbergia citrea]
MLKVIDIKKRYGKKEVVKNVSFTIEKGESFGLLGPNGAGKSTTISMICGLIPYDQGEVLVSDLSVKKSPMLIKEKIGVVPQEIALYPTMSAKDNLLFWGAMYGLSRSKAKKRVEEVLEFVGLQDRAKDRIETFSGGMKRRINIGAALMHEPELLIMDEPTVGIDPQSRNHILETVKKLNEKGMTIIYTSHYMEEVEFLCNRVGIIDHGEVIAIGTQTELCSRLVGGSCVQLTVENESFQAISSLKELENVKEVVKKESNMIEVFVQQPHETLGAIMTTAVNNGMKIGAVEIKEPNLETLFLQLTGRSLRD